MKTLLLITALTAIAAPAFSAGNLEDDPLMPRIRPLDGMGSLSTTPRPAQIDSDYKPKLYNMDTDRSTLNQQRPRDTPLQMRPLQIEGMQPMYDPYRRRQ